MPPFRPSDFQQLDWSLFHNTPALLYEDPDVLQDHIEWLHKNGYKIIHFSCKNWTTKEDMHSDFKNALSFPDYYGRNLDALSECLIDLVIEPGLGCVLVFHGFDSLAERERDTAWKLLDIVASASRVHLLLGERFMVLVQTDISGMTMEPFGASPLLLNPTEHLRRFREARSTKESE